MRIRAGALLSIVVGLFLLAASAVFADTIDLQGTGGLRATGNGNADLTLNGGTAHLEGHGVLRVKDVGGDASIDVSGTGNRQDLENGWTQYEGFGSATISGSDVRITVSGSDLSIRAVGSGSATLDGSWSTETASVSGNSNSNDNESGEVQTEGHGHGAAEREDHGHGHDKD